jgi:polygalacturonase
MIGRRTLLGSGVAGLGLAGCASIPRAQTADVWAEADRIVAGIASPRIGPGRVSITGHGARSGFDQDALPAVKAAIAALGQAGGRLVIPPGDWRMDGPIHLPSRVELHVVEGATVRFSTDPAHYLPVVFTRWEGTECWNYSPPIYAIGVEDVAITGGGTIDGQGFEGFFQWRARQKLDQTELRRMGAEGVPVAERVFGAGHYLRPSFVQFIQCRRVLIDGPRFVNSTFWMLHLVYSDQVIVRNVTLKSDHLNSDGVDPDSSTNVLVERCVFDCGDDGVAIKAGRDQDGWRVGRSASRIVVRDCDYRGTAGGGLSIGSEMSGGVDHVYCERYRMNDIVHALYFKSNRDRGGEIRDVHIRDVTIGTAQSVINFTTDYHGHRGGEYPTLFTDISITNVRCGEATVGVSLAGAAKAPLGRIALRNVAIDRAKTPLRSRFADGLTFDNVVVNGAPLLPQRDTGPETFGDTLKS